MVAASIVGSGEVDDDVVVGLAFILVLLFAWVVGGLVFSLLCRLLCFRLHSLWLRALVFVFLLRSSVGVLGFHGFVDS